jgi:hypothetical protein
MGPPKSVTYNTLLCLENFRCSQFEDLFSNVLFNYQWLYAKMSACPLQVQHTILHF